MPDSKRFLHPEAIKRISRMDLRARHIVEGFLSGMHRSPYFGQSIEFRQHREYTWGDDLRHVDWKVWARQDRIYVKQYESETNLRCTLLVDVSQSMLYGEGPLSKYEYGCTIAGSLGYLVLRQQDSIGCISFDEKIRNRVPLMSKRTHLLSIIESLNNSAPAQKSDIGKILTEAAADLPSRGLVVLISDLFGDPEATLKGLRLLRQRGHDVMVFHVMDDDELDFPFTGPTRFEGLETDDHLNCNPRALRDAYLEAVEAFLDTMRRGCAKHNIDYSLVRTRDSLEAVLAAFLSKRSESRRRG